MKTILPIVFTTLFLFTGCALQQDIMILEDRITYLERKNQEMQREVEQDLNALGKTSGDSEQNLRTKYAGLSVATEKLQEELRLVSGQIEEIEYLVNRKVAGYESAGKAQKGQLDKIAISAEKLDQRVARMEQYLSIDAKKQQKAANTNQSKTKTGTQLYSSARQAYDGGELDKARQLFQELLQKHPSSENADNAQFWIGESYYREKWYERAILEYQTVIEKFPKGNKVPAAMLKQGMALLNIGEKSSARLILEALVKKYPKATEAGIATKKLSEF